MKSTWNGALKVLFFAMLSINLFLGPSARAFAQSEEEPMVDPPALEEREPSTAPQPAQESPWVQPATAANPQSEQETPVPESVNSSGCSSNCDAQPEDSLPGFKANEILGGGPVDHVGIYSGDTGIVVPLGPVYELGPTFSWQLKAYNTVHFWHTWEQDQCAGSGANVIRGYIRGLPTLGVGWWLHMGYVAFPAYGLSDFGTLGPIYVSPDGAQHLTNGFTGVTMDGTHLRVTCSGTPVSCQVFFPDGTIENFASGSALSKPAPNSGYANDFDFGDASAPLGLTSIVDSFGTTLLSVSYNSGALSWQINTITLLPNSGSSKTISFAWNNGSGYAWPALNTVTFPGINGSSSQEQVAFSYDTNSGSAIQRTPADDSDAGECACTDASPSTATVLLLSGISLNSLTSGTATVAGSYSMCYNWSSYPRGDACQATTSNSGALNLITLPTGGTIAYTFAAQGPTSPCTPFPPLDLETTDSPGGCTQEEQPDIPQCDTCRICRMMANNTAVATRTMTDSLNGVVTTTSYTRRNFKPGDPNQTGNGYRTRLVEVTEQVDGSSSRLTRYLFHNPDINSTPDSSLGGLELEHSVSTGTTFTNSPVRLVVNCTGLDDALGNPISTCGYLNGSGAGQNYYGVNARPQASVTWYGKPAVIGTTDLGSCSEDTTPCVQDVSSGWSCYDTVGNYCGYGAYSTRIVSDANMVDSINRQMSTTWSPLINSSSWLLNLWTKRVVSDGAPAANTSDGASVVRSYASFDTSTHVGFLNAVWTWDSPSQTVRQECRYPNSDGTVLNQFTQTVAWTGSGEPTNQCPGVMPSVGTDSDAFGKSFTSWQNGQLRKANWVKGTSSIGWNFFDVDRDFASGMITNSRDANSLATSYAYDALGRITLIDPPGTEQPTTMCYFLPTDGVDSVADVYVKKNSVNPPPGTCATNPSQAGCPCFPDDGVPGAGSGTFESYQYDGLGRLVRKMRRYPNLLGISPAVQSYFSVKEFKYDVAGNMDYESEWTPCTPPSSAAAGNINACSTLTAVGLSTTTNQATQWSNYDPFGRARHILRADSTTTDIDRTDTGTSPSISYSDTLESVTVNGVGGGNPVTVTRKDPLGRVTSVTEPVVGGSADLTTYQYNVLDKLIGVAQGSQSRSFSFNAYGDITQEISPEKGVKNPDGTYTYYPVNFTSYGSLGNLRERQEGSGSSQVTIDTTYDAAGRVSKECAGSSGCSSGTLYLMNCYDGSSTCPDGSSNFAGGTYHLGRLTRRFGYSPLFKPLFPSGAFSESLQEDFGYSGVGGRLSDKTYTIASGANTNAKETWTFNTLGSPATHNHPRVGTNAVFKEQLTYASGLPTTVTLSGTSIAGVAIPGATVSATYGNAGQLASYSGQQGAGSTQTTTISFDSTLIPRPASIASSLGTFSTGTYSYDSAGNITAIGSDNFKYDARSRVVSALYSGQSTPCQDSLGNTGRSQCFGYDRWENLTGVTGVGPRPLCTDTGTNHLQQVTGSCPTLPGYDTRGNLTSYAPDTMSYDALNRQVEDYQSSSVDWQNLYSGADERSIRTTQGNSGASVTRREMARFLIEASDTPQLPAKCNSYPAIQDVPCSDPDWGYVEQALLDGITSGCQTNPLKYCPSDPIVRSSMAVMLVVAKYTKNYTPPACQSTNPNLPGYNPFTDVSNSSGFCPFIAQIYHDGVTAGCNQNPPQYCPGNPVTEQQMTIFMSVYWPGFHPISNGATYSLRDDENRVVTQLTDSIPGRDNVYLGPLLVGSYVSDATIDSTGWQFHSSDHLGTVRETWRVTQNTFEYHKFWPYGDEVGTNAPPTQKISFAAMERDVETNHYYDHARSHDFNLGRFVGVDKIGGIEDDPQSWNRYHYANANPLSYVDPNGRDAIAVVGAGAISPVAAGAFSFVGGVYAGLKIGTIVIGGQTINEYATQTWESVLGQPQILEMGRRQNETGLEGKSDEDLRTMEQDKSLPVETRRRAQRQRKFNQERNKRKDRGGPNKGGGPRLFVPAPGQDRNDSGAFSSSIFGPGNLNFQLFLFNFNNPSPTESVSTSSTTGNLGCGDPSFIGPCQ